jgi:hypothetical protein
MGKLFTLVACLFLFVFSAVGGFMAWKQANIVQGAQRVPAVILDKHLHSHQSRDSDGHTSTVYAPEITYRCDFDGGHVVSKEVYPFLVNRGGSSGREWAKSVLAQYKKGQQVEAWFNPRDPSQTFLIREISFFPYIFILAPAIFVAILIAVFVRGDGAQSDLGGSARLRKRGTVATTVMALVGAGVWKHYFDLAGDDTDDIVAPAMTVYFALTAIPFAVSLPQRGLAGRLKNALTFGGILAFVGVWLGLFGGILVEVVTGLIKSFGWMDQTIGGAHWVKYVAPVLGGIGFVFGLIVTEVTRESTLEAIDADTIDGRPTEFDSSFSADKTSDETGDGFSVGFEQHG